MSLPGRPSAGVAALHAATGGGHHPFADGSGTTVQRHPGIDVGTRHTTQILQSGALVALNDRSATVVSFDGYSQTYAVNPQTVLSDESGAAPRTNGAVLAGDWVLVHAARVAGEPAALLVTRESGPGQLLVAP